MVLFDGGSAIVGTLAKHSSVAEPERIADFVKREMGKPKSQFSREFDGKVYSAEELAALILKKLKNDAEKFLKEPVTDAVITVPAYFSDAERTATITAGTLAGLNVLQIINEPTAAAVAYGLDKLDQDQTVFVFDLGGGTFDVTIMRIEGHKLTMLATNGDHRLGGKDWDDVLVNFVAEEFDREHGENPLLDLQSYQELQSRALAAKMQLTSRPRTSIVHNYNGRSVKVEITREIFEQKTRHLVESCKTICEIVMQEAKLDWSGDRQNPARGRHDAHADGARDGGQVFARAVGRHGESGRSGRDRGRDSGDPGHAGRRRLPPANRCCRKTRGSNFPPAKAV